MDDKTEVAKVLGAMAMQLVCLVAGIICIGIGTNTYVAVGVLCLLLYTNMAKDPS